MTPATTTHAQALTAAADALARATIGNAGTLPISELYAMTAELMDGCRNLAQALSQLVAHVDARCTAVPLRVDRYGAAPYGTPNAAVTAVHGELYGASVLVERVVARLDHALSPLSTLAETGGRR